MIKHLFLVIIALFATGCTKVGPDYVPPCPDVPDRWCQELTDGLESHCSPIEAWWTVLDDPTLNCLIERGRIGSLDVREAAARIQEARALQAIAVGERFPDINSLGDAIRTRTSKDFPPSALNLANPANIYGINLVSATWEVDVWGRIARSIESATANFEASIEDYRDVLVILYAEIASAYTRVRTFQERIHYAESNAETQRETLKITIARFNAELISKLDIRQAELNLARTEADIPLFKALMIRAMNRLAVLLGEYPCNLRCELNEPSTIPAPPANIAIGLPCELIRQRPDIRRAEREVAAQVAQIGVATAELYPQFTLFGSFGYRGTADVLFNNAKKMWTLGADYFWNLFDGGRVRGEIQVEYVRAEQAWLQYEQTLLESVEEVESSMSAFVLQGERVAFLEASVVAAQKSVDLVQIQYKNGLTNFDNVLDMERSLFEQQDLLAQGRGFVTQNLIDIYKALGGGWRIECEE